MTTYQRDIVYDSYFNGVKLEMRPVSEEDTEFYVTDPLFIIHDFNIGVSFTRNEKLGNCSITPLTANSLDVDAKFTQLLVEQNNTYVIKLKSPDSLFSLDSDHIYIGKRLTNNVPSDVYLSNRTTTEGRPMLTEFAFVDEDFTFETTIGNINQFPLSLHRISPEVSHFDSYFVWFF